MNYSPYEIHPHVQNAAKEAEKLIKPAFEKIEQTEQYNGEKVLKAFTDNKVSASHLSGSSGYGYGDIGRDMLDKVFAQAFGASDALVRHSIASGTHALTIALFGLLRPDDLLLSITGKPYDTLEEVIGLRGCSGTGSLADFGVKYKQIDLTDGRIVDIKAAVENAPNAKIVYIQRSSGYSLRPSITVQQIKLISEEIKRVNPNAIIMIDNCYGEFVEVCEPTGNGADIIVGSLIKNPGGGIARGGGYIAGRQDLIELCAQRLTTPGTGREVGCSLDELRSMYLGFFLAPTVVASALKTAVFASALFEILGYETFPKYAEPRSDIIQAIKLGSPEKLVAFCQAIQSCSPIDSFASPEPWDMPGYDSQVIMAAGAFTLGSSIELSADAPLREPYAVWLQGGLTYPTGKAGILAAASRLFTA